nr:cAMP dependent protein kinase catalytic subunit [Hymenolepis microstoma]
MTQAEFELILAKKAKEFIQVYNSPPKGNASWDVFTRIRTLGKGAFGRVLLVRYKDTEKYYAMKVLSKLDIVKSRQITSAILEKKILASVNIEQITRLVYTFKDNSFLYLVMEFVPGGELFSLLRSMKYFSESMVKFFAAQVLLAFEYLHFLTIAYRDLKPENLLLTADGFIKVTDLGFAKMLPVDKRTWTVCGTPDYMAPEIIMNKGYGHAVDWWAFGVLLYEMTAGFPPFMHQEQMKTFEHIISGKLKFTNQFSSDLKDLIKNLIQTDLSKRYGNLKNGVMDIKGHPYFNDTDFMSIFNHAVKPPYVPKVKNPGDASNYEKWEEEELIVAEREKFATEFAEF